MSWAWRFALLVFALLVQIPGAQKENKKMKEKRKMKRRKGFADPRQAYGWSYYRYTRYNKKPHQQDKHASMLAGGDVKCDVCKVILTKALGDLIKAKLLTGGIRDQENIEEHLEADEIDLEKIEKAKSRMEKYVEKYKKGCNKLFKENFLELGWDVVACHQQLPFDMPNQPPEGRIPWACARNLRKVPSKMDMNTYTVERESIHYACEATITRHRDELAQFLAKNYSAFKKKPLESIAEEACKQAAKCTERKPTETIEARTRKLMGLHDEKNDYIDQELKKFKKEWKKAKKEKGKAKDEQKRKQGADRTVEL